MSQVVHVSSAMSPSHLSLGAHGRLDAAGVLDFNIWNCRVQASSPPRIRKFTLGCPPRIQSSRLIVVTLTAMPRAGLNESSRWGCRGGRKGRKDAVDLIQSALAQTCKSELLNLHVAKCFKHSSEVP